MKDDVLIVSLKESKFLIYRNCNQKIVEGVRYD